MELFSVNPKSVHSSELFGDFDPYTRDWTDGLIALATRKFSNELQPQHGTPEEHAGRPVSTGNQMTNSSEASQVQKNLLLLKFFIEKVFLTMKTFTLS